MICAECSRREVAMYLNGVGLCVECAEMQTDVLIHITDFDGRQFLCGASLTGSEAWEVRA